MGKIEVRRLTLYFSNDDCNNGKSNGEKSLGLRYESLH